MLKRFAVVDDGSPCSGGQPVLKPLPWYQRERNRKDRDPFYLQRVSMSKMKRWHGSLQINIMIEYRVYSCRTLDAQ
jgi:hypothetical protein